MKKKLLLCVILALLLALPAFAGEYSTQIDAACNLPDISVVVPGTAQVFINPYKIPVTIEGDETTAQIVSTPAAIENKSEVPLSITAEVTGSIRAESDMRLSTLTTAGMTSKSAFIYFEMQAASSGNPSQVTWDSGYDSEKHLIVRNGTSRPKNMVIIAQTSEPKHFGAFRLTGDCVPNPRSPWTENDGIDVEIAFTFKPLPVWTEIS